MSNVTDIDAKLEVPVLGGHETVVETSRLRLRVPVEQDAEAIISIAGDWEVARQLARVPHPYTHADVHFFLSHVVPNEPTWAILSREMDQPIGMIGLAPALDGHSAELGYYIAREHWRRGIATEAARAIGEMAFNSFGYRKLTSGYFSDNPASGRVLAKLGFTIIGTSSRPCLAEGKNKASVEVELVLPVARDPMRLTAAGLVEYHKPYGR